MTEIVRVKSAPGLKWVKRDNNIFEARWRCRADLVEKGYLVKSVKLWSGTGDPTKEEWDFIADTCAQLQQEMQVWARGGLPTVNVFNGTIGGLIYCYRNDPDSKFRKKEDKGGIRYASRVHYDALMSMIDREHGHKVLADIKGRTVQHWYDEWSARSLATAHAKIKMLRTLFKFGIAFLEDDDCARISTVLREMKFRMPKARNEWLTADQATAIRAKAWELGRPSIALAQAFQFELMLRQKDVIGEWVPVSEPGMSDTIDSAGNKWLRGIRFEEINHNFVLSHVTSKRLKKITVDLKNAPMVLEELNAKFPGSVRWVEVMQAGKIVIQIIVDRALLPASGPIIVSEFDKLPWTAIEFRRWWRICADACGVPPTVRNMDSRAGAITEASDAKADLEHIRQAATHSDIAMTQRYSRGSEGKIEIVQLARIAHRNKPRTEKS